MHATRVIGDKQAALAKVSGVRDKIRPAGKIFNSAWRKSSGDFGGDGRVARGAEQHELLLGQTGDQGTPMKNRPAFSGLFSDPGINPIVVPGCSRRARTGDRSG